MTFIFVHILIKYEVQLFSHAAGNGIFRGNHEMLKTILSILFCFASVSAAYAQAASCDSLDAKSLQVAKAAFGQIHGYGCCTDTVESCLNKAAECKSVSFVADEICRLSSKGKKADEIKEIIDLRAKAMAADARIYDIEVKPKHIWGNPDSKVVLSVYLCGRCPYCSRHVPLLIHTLEKTALKDQIAVNLRYFPIKSHDNSTPAALAIEAAAQLGKAWPYLLKSYENFDAFTLNQIHVWAQEIGMDKDAFASQMKDAATRSTVSKSKKEGLVNGVTTTPTFFINGRRIEGKFDVDSIVSILKEELAMQESAAAPDLPEQH